jgi:hypothetical protein
VWELQGSKNEADKEQMQGYTGNSRQMDLLEFQDG